MRFLYFTISLLLLISCNTKQTVTNNQEEHKVSENTKSPTIQLRSATDLKSKGLLQGQILIDVRTPEEIAEGKISGAIEIDYMANDFKAQIAALDKSKDYVMYCRSGGRSGKAAELMLELGFTKVTNITGGYMEYSK